MESNKRQSAVGLCPWTLCSSTRPSLSLSLSLSQLTMDRIFWNHEQQQQNVFPSLSSLSQAFGHSARNLTKTSGHPVHLVVKWFIFDFYFLVGINMIYNTSIVWLTSWRYSHRFSLDFLVIIFPIVPLTDLQIAKQVISVLHVTFPTI